MPFFLRFGCRRGLQAVVALSAAATVELSVPGVHSQAQGISSTLSPAMSPTTIALTDKWYGLFLNSQHVGYLHVLVQKAPNASGNASRPRKEMRIEMLFDPTPGSDADKSTLNFHAFLKPDDTCIESWESHTAAGQTTTVHKTFQGNKVIIEEDAPHKPRTHRVLSLAENAGKNTTASGNASAVSFNVDIFSKTPPADWKRGKNEIITVDWRPISALRVNLPALKDGSNGTVWLDKNRAVVRMDMVMSGVEFRVERMSQATATHLVTPLPKQDGITPTKPLEEARVRRSRAYVISGLTTPPLLTDDEVETTVTQKQTDGHYTSIVQITAAPLDEAKSVLLSAIDQNKFARFLASGSLTPANDPAMRTLARQIVGSETNAARVVKRLDHWIHTNLAYDWGFSGFRSAQQTLQDRRGVCQNYATLLVTLARAAGIPAKYCSGPTYCDDGKFYRHAWAECWTGKWVAVEPTWGQPFADAAHIKLAEGEPDASLSGWDNNAPPTINALPATVDIAQVIRENTPASTSETASLAVETALAKQILQNALSLSQESVLLVANAGYPPLVLGQLPWGSTTRFDHSRTVRLGATNDLASGTRYLLPDGRACLVVETGRKEALTPEKAVAFSFEYKSKDTNWQHAYIPYFPFDRNRADVVKQITAHLRLS